MPLEHLWATWRANYVTGVTDSRTAPSVDGDAIGLSLFERILAAPGTDAEKYIVVRGDRTFVILNRFPYTVGHLMVLPTRAVADLLTGDCDCRSVGQHSLKNVTDPVDVVEIRLVKNDVGGA